MHYVWIILTGWLLISVGIALGCLAGAMVSARRYAASRVDRIPVRHRGPRRVRARRMSMPKTRTLRP